MEKVARADLLVIDNICDECGKNVMRPTGEVLQSNPPQYVHKCLGCGHTANYLITYPASKYILTEPFRDPTEIEKQ